MGAYSKEVMLAANAAVRDYVDAFGEVGLILCETDITDALLGFALLPGTVDSVTAELVWTSPSPGFVIAAGTPTVAFLYGAGPPCAADPCILAEFPVTQGSAAQAGYVVIDAATIVLGGNYTLTALTLPGHED